MFTGFNFVANFGQDKNFNTDFQKNADIMHLFVIFVNWCIIFLIVWLWVPDMQKCWVQGTDEIYLFLICNNTQP